MKKGIAVILVLFLAGLLAGCGGDKKAAPPAAKGEYKAQLKLASMTPASHTYNLGAVKFAELVKERSKGRIEIKVFPDGQLGKGERELLEGMQQGNIDIYVGSTGPLGNFSPSMLINDIPFLFRDFNHVDKVLDGPIGAQLLADLDKSGLKGLAFWENGFRNLTNSKLAIKTPADAKGMKIRTMENKMHMLAFKTAGLNPTPMAWSEVFGALQQKVIDGQENPVVVIYTSKIYEVQKFLSLTQHVYSPAVLIVSSKKWQGMPKEDQEMLLKTAKEVAQYQRKLGRDAEEKQLGELAAKGMTITKDVDKKAWQDAMQPAFADFSKQFGKEKIDAILNTK